MQLKRFTDLGLRVLVFLADKTDRPTALIDIVDALQWNKNQLIKVERFMVKAGWVTAVRVSSDIETNPPNDIKTDPPFSAVKRGFWRQAVA